MFGVITTENGVRHKTRLPIQATFVFYFYFFVQRQLAREGVGIGKHLQEFEQIGVLFGFVKRNPDCSVGIVAQVDLLFFGQFPQFFRIRHAQR